MTERKDSPEESRELIREARSRGFLATLALYTRMSGPGWLQGAITLGGGSLAGALYLGVIMGYGMMWLQPVAMILGVVMLSAIAYVALSTGERPFGLINQHVSPVLGWAWLIAAMMANIVWSLPQFVLGTAAVQQNIAPATDSPTGKYVVAAVLLIVTAVIVWFYNSGSRGIRIFEIILKSMVGVVVLSFFGVVIALTVEGGLDWAAIWDGMIPRLSYLFEPVPSMSESINATSDPDWWSSTISATQKDKIITAFATAVGINMTFLLPYSMLKKKWDQEHRGLAIFDLSIGLVIPFVLATGCVVIAAASQFHAKHDDVTRLVEQYDADVSAAPAGEDVPTPKEVKSYFGFLDRRIEAAIGEARFATLKEGDGLAAERKSFAEADRHLAAMLAARDNQTLAKTLEHLVGPLIAQKLFGIGVLGMAVSTIIILMLINGFAFCEMIGVEPGGTAHRIGTLIPGVGVLGPFIWSEAAPKLATPTSVIGGAMLPIAYVSFLLLMNSRRALGEAMPTGGKRFLMNLVMGLATLVALFGSAWGMYGKTLGDFPIGLYGLVAIGLLLVLGIGSFVVRNRA